MSNKTNMETESYKESTKDTDMIWENNKENFYLYYLLFLIYIVYIT